MANLTEASSDTPDPVPQERRRLVPPPGKSPLVRALELSAALAAVIGILAGAYQYVSEADDRHQRTVSEAWQVITSAQGQEGSGGRVTALEYLNKDGKSLVGVSLKGAFLENLDLKGAYLNWANFQEAALDGVDLREAQLWRANLRAAYLGSSYDEEGRLDRKARLDEADLEEADLRDADLTDASLRNTRLKFANLNGAVLDDADLQKARLSEVNLQQASLRRADLRDASLGGANLEDADIRGADLRRANSLFPEQLAEAIGNQDTILSEHIERPSSWQQGTGIPLSFGPEDPPLKSKVYSSKAFEPAMYFSVGEGWRANSDIHDLVALYHGYRSGSTLHDLGFINVQEVFDPSDPTYDLRRYSLDNVLPPPEDLALWLQKHPHLNAEVSGREPVDGKPAVQLDVIATSTPSNYPTNCSRPCVPLFRDSQGGWWSLYEGYRSRMILPDVEGETIVFTIESPVGETDEFFPMADKVVDSVRWVDNVEVPDLSGMTQEEANDRVGRNFALEASYRPSGEPENRVVNQHPLPGEPMTQGSEISLMLSQGSEPAITYKTLSDESGMLIEVGVDKGWTTSQIDKRGNKVGLTVLTTDRAANVIVASEPLESGFDEAQLYAENQGKLLQQDLPQYHQLSFEATSVFGVPGFRRVFEWDPKNGKPITQIQQYYAENGRGYVATATARPAEFEEYEPQLLDALHRITLIR